MNQNYLEKIEKCAEIFSCYDIVDPEKQCASLSQSPFIKNECTEFLLKGSLSKRMVFCKHKSNQWLAISLTRRPLSECMIDSEVDFFVADAGNLVSEIEISDGVYRKLKGVHTKLIVLCHPDNFPMPRFALGVAYLAGALRDSLLGCVSIYDMQTAPGLPSLIRNIESEKPDIVGISVTFGQNDLLDALIDAIGEMNDYAPKILIGGSVAALNRDAILAKHPHIHIALANGEKSVVDFAKWHIGLLDKKRIDSIAYSVLGETVTTSKTYKSISHLPELDLLDGILNMGGVFNLETSRGCFNSCTFCPRENKGGWRGMDVECLAELLPYLKAAFSRYPDFRKKIFVVDEEFIGKNSIKTEIDRANNLIKLFRNSGFKFEINARIDQIFNPKTSNEWHVERVKFWRNARNMGLKKCLFGVESGVDSVLERFGKNVKSSQNVGGVSLFTSSVGHQLLRTTYITFDPLMSMDELIETYQFQGRKDIILKKTDLPPEQLVKVVRSNEYVKEYSLCIPYYSIIPYMLVSIECLVGSNYTKKVANYGLLRELNFGMAKYNSEYLDKRIGLMSHFGQRWIDRNFALDYALKSYMKISDGDDSVMIAQLRRLLKDSSYELLGNMLCVSNSTDKFSQDPKFWSSFQNDNPVTRWKGDTHAELYLNLLKAQHGILRRKFTNEFDLLRNPSLKAKLARFVEAWEINNKWSLINE